MSSVKNVKVILFFRKIQPERSDFQLFFDLSDFLNGKIQILLVVGRGYLGANSCSPFGNHRIGESYHVNSLFQELFRHFLSKDCISEHNRHDWMFTGENV